MKINIFKINAYLSNELLAEESLKNKHPKDISFDTTIVYLMEHLNLIFLNGGISWKVSKSIRTVINVELELTPEGDSSDYDYRIKNFKGPEEFKHLNQKLICWLD